MQYRLVDSSPGNRRLLLLYAGWAMDSRPFSSLSYPGYDVAVVWDYTDLESPLPISDDYCEICLIAWSYGVYAAAVTLGGFSSRITRRIAVNGTMYPIDGNRGIPENVFDATLNSMDSRNLRKFYRRMFQDKDCFARFWEVSPRRSTDDVVLELKSFGHHVRSGSHSGQAFRWDYAIIGRNDAIMPPCNQRAAWEGVTRVQVTDDAHMVDFQALIDRYLIDKALVANRFSRASCSYSLSATAQSEAARSLWRLHCSRPMASEPFDILEVGSGSGLMTGIISGAYPDSRLLMWDLVDYGVGHGHNMRFVACDAETEIRTLADSSIDMIVSAATIQWFNSPLQFICECSRVLRPGGRLLVSSFGEDNLSELTSITGVALPALSLEDIAMRLPASMVLSASHKETLDCPFDTVTEALTHLRDTGVNALRYSGTSMASVRKVLSCYPLGDDGKCHLYYRPFYMVIEKIQ